VRKPTCGGNLATRAEVVVVVVVGGGGGGGD